MNYSERNNWAYESLVESDDEIISEYDDEIFSESDEEIYSESEDEIYSESEEEFLGLIPAGIGAAINGVRNLIRKKPGRTRRISSYMPGPGFLNVPKASGQYSVNPASQLSGVLYTNKGPFSFSLPQNVATKEDLKKLASSVSTDIKKVTDATKKNAGVIRTNVAAIRKVTDDLKSLDKKHSAVELKQTQLISNLNKRVVKLKKDNEAVKQQIQMNSMLNLLMQPKLESIRVKEETTNTDGSKDFEISKSKFKSDMFPLVLMMSMSGNSSEGSSGNMWSNPMMMFVMMEAFKD